MNDTAETIDFKEPRLSEPTIDGLDNLQQGRLKSAYEWGNLEDAIFDRKKENGNASDTESLGNMTPEKKISTGSMDMMSEVLAAADKFDKEIGGIQLNDVIEIVEREKIEERFEIPNPEETKEGTSKFTWEVNEVEENDENTEANSNVADAIDDTRRFIEEECRNGTYIENHIEVVAPKRGKSLSSSVKEKNQVNDIDFDAQSEQAEVDQMKADNNDQNSLEDGKKYPLGSLERPKSEVFKKLIAQQNSDDDLKLTNGVSTTNITPDMEEITVERITTATRYTEVGPISLTLSGLNESDLTESSQISPVFSSDGQGVNSISISSTESTIRMEPKTVLAVDNMVTVTTDDSQPSSIILIDDEKLDFTVSTIDEGNEANKAALPPPAPPRASKDEVFIIESLSSKKVQDKSALNNGEQNNSQKGFVTEICLRDTNKDHALNLKNLNKTMEENNNTKMSAIPLANSTTTKTTQSPSTTKITNSTSNGSSASSTPEKPVIVEEEYIPRNSEIKFTTSTYQSPRSIEKRHSHIDQIRSNFERNNHSSEIPVPIRKNSAPTTPPPPQSSVRTSPSKIPVFNSQKSSDNLLKNNGNVNRVSVSVTSIKNSSKHPSGK